MGMGAITDLTVKGADGMPVDLAAYAGQVLLIVNTASKCGFTPQYAGLEALHRKFKDRGFAVLGFPCNQFGAQEPGDAAEIASFCTVNYDVTFPLFAKIDVNGSNADPLYQALRKAAPGLMGTTSIKWNFTKFLVARDGRTVQRFGPRMTPEALEGAVEMLF